MAMHRLLLILITFLALTACEDILNKEPLGQLSEGNFFQTSHDAVQGINAAYQYLLFNNDNKNFYWAFGTVTSDDAIAGGDGSRPGIVELDFLTHTARTEEFNDFWRVNYAGITQCNSVLENVPVIDMDEGLKNQILGEALFLRAYYYFNLAQVFGDVPLMTQILP
ncbi:MAG: RagB/SusD family nutrient uptake outer membrane protein, partial [Phaeodactylibacter sp.]|nr:RagB/SusD family nutrient uptake outer membrane protein [Phaeodactylibacter sp.]